MKTRQYLAPIVSVFVSREGTLCTKVIGFRVPPRVFEIIGVTIDGLWAVKEIK